MPGTGRRRPKQLVEDLARAAAYAFFVVSGVGALLFPLQSYDQITASFNLGWGVLQIPSVAAMIAVLAGKPLLEWRVLPVLAAGIGLYVAISWIAFGTQVPSHLGRAGEITGLLFLILARFFSLWQKVEDAERLEAVLSTQPREDRP